MVVPDCTGIEACIQAAQTRTTSREGDGVTVDILILPYIVPLQFASFFLFALLSQVRNDGDDLGF